MFTLENFFPYLVNSVTIPIALDFHKKMKPYGITIEKWRVLSVLMNADGQSVSELARATSIEISRLSHLLNRMARQGLVGRARAKGDGRVVTVRLTPRGRALALKILPMALQYEVSALQRLQRRRAGRAQGLCSGACAPISTASRRKSRHPAGSRDGRRNGRDGNREGGPRVNPS